MKKCSKCKQDKVENEFGVSLRTKDKLNSWCKSCVREKSKQWYAENFNISKKKNSKRIQDRRNWLNELKEQLKCIKCEENHISCLDFHHLDSSQKEFGIAESINRLYYSKEKIINEIKKCIVLCSNCHKKFHYLESLLICCILFQ